MTWASSSSCGRHGQDHVGVPGEDTRAADAVDGVLARLVALGEVGTEDDGRAGLRGELLDLVEQAGDVAGVVLVAAAEPLVDRVDQDRARSRCRGCAPRIFGMSAEKSVAWPRRFQRSKPVKSSIPLAAAIRLDPVLEREGRQLEVQIEGRGRGAVGNPHHGAPVDTESIRSIRHQLLRAFDGPPSTILAPWWSTPSTSCGGSASGCAMNS